MTISSHKAERSEAKPPRRGPSHQKKWTAFLFIVYFLACSLLAGCVKAKEEIRNIDSRGKNIICFGDSITYGYGASPGEDYPASLARMIGIPVINSGIDGDTTTEALKRIEQDVLSREPLLVIIEFSGNDFLRKVKKEVTVNNIKLMVEKAQAKGAMVAIVDISAGILLSEYTEPFRKIAREKKAIFIPALLKGIITNSHLKSDFIHPNAAGYKMIAQRIYRTIIPHLNQNTVSRNLKQ